MCAKVDSAHTPTDDLQWSSQAMSDKQLVCSIEHRIYKLYYMLINLNTAQDVIRLLLQH
jgi:hypothetical protein